MHVKKLQCLCGQDLSGLHFLLDRAECGARTLPESGKQRPAASPPHLCMRPSPLWNRVSARPGWGFGTLCGVAAGATGQVPLRGGCQARCARSPPPPTCRETSSARGTKRISHHVTGLNIDNDFKGGKVAHPLIPANAAERFQQALAGRNNSYPVRWEASRERREF